jgi:hypothetical protein
MRTNSLSCLSTIVIGVLLVVGAVEGISTLSIKGTKFYNAQGGQVFFKGHITLLSKLAELMSYRRCIPAQSIRSLC